MQQEKQQLQVELDAAVERCSLYCKLILGHLIYTHQLITTLFGMVYRLCFASQLSKHITEQTELVTSLCTIFAIKATALVGK